MFELPRVTPKQEQLLREQVITAEQPGTLLKDFNRLLEFIGTGGVPASGKYNLLSIHHIKELDELLTRPLRLKLKRPLMKSHPYLLGLNLVLRASGLTSVEGVGSKAKLVVNPEVLGRWQQLNPTEQYFNLLGTWLLESKGEMVGEGRGFGSALCDCAMVWKWLPEDGMTYDQNRPQDAILPGGVYRQFHQVALMDLFGLMRVDHFPEPVQPWCPAAIHHHPFGDALFAVLAEGDSHNFIGVDLFLDEEGDGEEGEHPFDRWQRLLRPYFPEWENNLALPEPEYREGVFVFRVSLGKVWRRLAIVDDETLETLAGAILDSVEFDDDHLYEFIYRDQRGASRSVFHPYMDEGPATTEVRIGEIPLKVGEAMTFHFDFGDDWRFTVQLEEITRRTPTTEEVRLLEEHGKAPRQYPHWDEE